MPSLRGFIEDGSLYLRKTYRYDDSEDMEEFEGIIRDEDLTVEYFDDHVDVTVLARVVGTSHTPLFKAGWP